MIPGIIHEALSAGREVPTHGTDCLTVQEVLVRVGTTLLVSLVALLVASACAPAPAAGPASTVMSAPATSAPDHAAPSSVPATSAEVSPCPIAPVTAIAVENFYGNILKQLGGQCVNVTSVLTDPSADPHEYQPSANDAKSYQTAQFIVENGLGYDDFSDRIIATLSKKPVVLNVGDMLGLKVGDNPHVWYSPDYVEKIARAMTQGLKQTAPSAGSYFDERASAFSDGLAAYRAALAQLQTRFKGTPIGSTESIFAYMASAAGLNLVSPPTFMKAVSEGNDPAARDLALFQDQITKHQIKVLVYNTQTVNNLTDQLKTMATADSVPIVGVSETMPLDATSFQDWQVNQLQQLIKALAGNGG